MNISNTVSCFECYELIILVGAWSVESRQHQQTVNELSIDIKNSQRKHIFHGDHKMYTKLFPVYRLRFTTMTHKQAR